MSDIRSSSQRKGLAAALALFAGGLLLSWLTHGTGWFRTIARNIYIPDELTMPLQVKAAYNGRTCSFATGGRHGSLRSITT